MVTEWLGLQIQARAFGEQAAEDLCYRAFRQLIAFPDNTTLNGHRYLGMQPEKSPTQLKIDGTRTVYYCEFLVAKG